MTTRSACSLRVTGTDTGSEQPALRAPSIADLADRPEVNGVALEAFDERFSEVERADGVEEDEQPRGGTADVAAALRESPQEGLAAAGGAREPVETTVLAGPALLVCEALEMHARFDLLAAVPAARRHRRLSPRARAEALRVDRAPARSFERPRGGRAGQASFAVRPPSFLRQRQKHENPTAFRQQGFVSYLRCGPG